MAMYENKESSYTPYNRKHTVIPNEIPPKQITQREKKLDPAFNHLTELSSLSGTERAFLGWGLHSGSPIDLLPKPSL